MGRFLVILPRKCSGICLVFSLLLFVSSIFAAQFVARLSPQEEKLVKLMQTNERRISAYQVNEFHRLLLTKVIYPSNQDITLEYGGIVRDDGRRSLRIEDSYGSPLKWRLVGDFGIASFWISTERTEFMIDKCKVGTDDVFVNRMATKKGADDAVSSLGNKSLREFLKPVFVHAVKK